MRKEESARFNMLHEKSTPALPQPEKSGMKALAGGAAVVVGCAFVGVVALPAVAGLAAGAAAGSAVLGLVGYTKNI